MSIVSYRRNTCRTRRQEAQRPRQQERRLVGAVRSAVRLRADVGGEILGAPGEACDTRGQPSPAAEAQHGARLLGDDGQHRDGAARDSVRCLERLEPVIDAPQVVERLGLRQQDAVRPRRDHGREIGERIGAVDGIDAHPLRHRTAHGCEVPCDLDACSAAAIGRDRILEVEDHGVRAARRGLREAFRAVTRNEQQ